MKTFNSWKDDMNAKVEEFMASERKYWRRADRLSYAKYMLAIAATSGVNTCEDIWFWQQIVARNEI